MSTASTDDGAQNHGAQNHGAQNHGAQSPGRQKWAALAKHNERLVDASHPLLADLRRDHPDVDRTLPAAS